MTTVDRANHDLALAGLGLGIAVLAGVWVVVHSGFGGRRLMVDDLDIYRSAHGLIEEHGEDAPIHAAMRADELMGAATWRAWPCGSGS